MKLGRVLTILVTCAVAASIAADRLTFGRARAYDSAIMAYIEAADVPWEAEDGEEPTRELLERAVARCDEAIELEPDWHPAYYFRAATLIELDELERAVTDLRRCIELYDPSPSVAPISSIPSRGEALELLATCERRLGRAERALDAVLRLESCSDGFIGPSIESVLVRRALGRRDEASSFIAKFIEDTAPFVRSDGHLARALLHLDAGSSADALESLESARANRSAHPQVAAWIDPAIESAAAGRIEEARSLVLGLLEERR